MADRVCEACGQPLEAEADVRRRLCRRGACLRERSRARKRKQRGEVVEFPAASPDAGSLTDAVRVALEEAGTSTTWEGRNALLLAERLVAAERESGSAIAALSAKLESSMMLALRPRPGQSFADELRRKRQERARGGSA